ncbi:MAG: glycine cleavage system protein H [Candidatus Marinimicrobia bacterium]|nr:glycine cleavage system protein H [Candidatus Neomarinimicrobiota bacterium]|tara:strand:+ start:2727 stop:3101 length:375 start_codon:yes stop_codon:yes gene_type:complete
MLPDNIKYTKDHEWVLLDGNQITVGITDYAQSELGDIIFIEFPDKGTSFKRGESVGTIEAVKTVADIYCPADGLVIEVNSSLENEPDLINSDPYNNGWIIKMEIKDKESINKLLNKEQYLEVIS